MLGPGPCYNADVNLLLDCFETMLECSAPHEFVLLGCFWLDDTTAMIDWHDRLLRAEERDMLIQLTRHTRSLPLAFLCNKPLDGRLT
jgi:hypothetical protein